MYITTSVLIMNELQYEENGLQNEHHLSTRKKNTVLVLLGCSILQLPIWGESPIHVWTIFSH